MKGRTMLLPKSTIGRKLLMAFTGQVMILFIVFHVLGNSTVYFSTINAYAAGLRAVPYLVWPVRLVLVVLFLFHVVYGIIVTLENRASRPQRTVTEHQRSTIAGRTMVWTGILIGLFLVYHLLHFTVQVTNPEIAALHNADALGRPDVFLMMMESFQEYGIVALYAVGVIALGLHLFHGIQSSFQTWGLNSDRSFPLVTNGGMIAAVIIFLGYVAIPMVIVAGILK